MFSSSSCYDYSFETKRTWVKCKKAFDINRTRMEKSSLMTSRAICTRKSSTSRSIYDNIFQKGKKYVTINHDDDVSVTDEGVVDSAARF